MLNKAEVGHMSMKMKYCNLSPKELTESLNSLMNEKYENDRKIAALEAEVKRQKAELAVLKRSKIYFFNSGIVITEDGVPSKIIIAIQDNKMKVEKLKKKSHGEFYFSPIAENKKNNKRKS